VRSRRNKNIDERAISRMKEFAVKRCKIQRATACNHTTNLGIVKIQVKPLVGKGFAANGGLGGERRARMRKPNLPKHERHLPKGGILSKDSGSGLQGTRGGQLGEKRARRQCRGE